MQLNNKYRVDASVTLSIDEDYTLEIKKTTFIHIHVCNFPNYGKCASIYSSAGYSIEMAFTNL